jgi:hypothetical protein
MPGMMPPPPPAKNGGAGKTVAIVVGALVLVGALIVGVVMITGGGRTGSRCLDHSNHLPASEAVGCVGGFHQAHDHGRNHQELRSPRR